MNDNPSQPIVSVSSTTSNFGEPDNNPRRPGRKMLIIIASIVGGLIVIGAMVALLVGSMSKTENTPKLATPGMFTDWLKPAGELKISDNRYVSPCQAFPEESFDKIFSPLPGTSVVKEQYFEESLPTPRHVVTPSSPEATCEYQFNPLGGANLVVKLKQLSDPYDYDDIGRSSRLDIRDDPTKRLVNEYANLKGVKSNPDALALVATMQKALQANQRVEANDSTLPANSLENAVLPDSNKYARDFSFIGVHKNIVITITHQVSEKEPKSISDKDKVAELARMQQVFATIQKNIDNPTLSQSPSPTIRIVSNKVGDTTVLEPCRVLDAEAFSSALGVVQNGYVERTSLPLDTTKDRLRGDKSLALSKNACKRNYDAGLLPDDYALTPGEQKYQRAGYADIDLELEYAKTDEQATKGWDEAAQGERSIETSADKAVLWGSDTLTGAYFKVGNYIGSFSISEVQSAAAFEEFIDLPASDSEYVSAINKMVENIKTLQAQKQ